MSSPSLLPELCVLLGVAKFWLFDRWILIACDCGQNSGACVFTVWEQLKALQTYAEE